VKTLKLMDEAKVAATRQSNGHRDREVDCQLDSDVDGHSFTS
jgi:hypothetical protein